MDKYACVLARDPVLWAFFDGEPVLEEVEAGE
jgi:hypothetical protein